MTADSGAQQMTAGRIAIIGLLGHADPKRASQRRVGIGGQFGRSREQVRADQRRKSVTDERRFAGEALYRARERVLVGSTTELLTSRLLRRGVEAGLQQRRVVDVAARP